MHLHRSTSKSVHLTSFDIGILIIFAFSTILGFLRRLSGEILNVAAWAFAFVCALSFSDWLAEARFFRWEIFGSLFEAKWTRVAICAMFVFFFIYIAIRFCMSRLRTLIGSTPPRGGGLFLAWDKGLGAVYGFGRGLIFSSLIYWIVIWITPTPNAWPEWMTHSKTRPILAIGQSYLAYGLERIQKTAVVRALFKEHVNEFEEDMTLSVTPEDKENLPTNHAEKKPK